MLLNILVLMDSIVNVLDVTKIGRNTTLTNKKRPNPEGKERFHL